MKLLDRFRYWVAEPLLERLRDDMTGRITALQGEAYEIGYKAGRAHGELVGQQMMLGDLSRILSERNSVTMEVTEADIERAKKGMVH